MLRSGKRAYLLVVLLIISAVVTLALLVDAVPFLRGGFGWRWPYQPLNLSTLRLMLSGMTILVIYLLGLWFLRDQPTIFFLAWVLLGAVAIPIGFLVLYGSPLYVLYTRTVSELTTGAYLEAAEFTNLHILLHQWPAEMAADQAALTHMSTSPPAWAVAYLWTAKGFAAFPELADRTALMLRQFQCDNLPIMSHSNAQIASAWLGLLSPLWGALTVIPLYFLGRELDEEATARTAVAWWPLVPSLTAFMATLNTVYPLMVTSTVLLFVMGLNRRGPRPALGNAALFLAGIGAAACLTVNFVMVPVFLLCGLLILIYQPTGLSGTSGQFWVDKIKIGIPFALGVLLVLLAYRVVAAYHLHSLVPLALGEHLNLKRAYIPWLWFHTWDVLLFVGLPVFALYVVSLFRFPDGPSRRFGRAVALAFLIMVISGTARGETGRLWNFFMPFFLLGMGALLAHSPALWGRAFMTAQIGWLLVIVAVIPAVGTGLPTPPVYAALVSPPLENAPFIPVSAAFGDDLLLTGYQAGYLPGRDQIVLDLAWQARRQPTTSYLFSALTVDPQGTVQNVKDWLPLDYQYPTTCWLPEAGPIHDQVVIDLPKDALRGDWWLSLSAFSLEDDAPPVYLPVTMPSGEVDEHQTGLGPIPVSP